MVRIHITGTSGQLIEKKVEFVKEGCKYFFNVQHQLLQLERGERAFYDFLCERMDTKNRVMINMTLRDNFSEFIMRITSKKLRYTPGSISSYIKTLLELGLLIRQGPKNSGYYIVNPKYAFAGPENARVNLLRALIANGVATGSDISALVPVPQDVFLKDAVTDDKATANVVNPLPVAR